MNNNAQFTSHKIKVQQHFDEVMQEPIERKKKQTHKKHKRPDLSYFVQIIDGKEVETVRLTKKIKKSNTEIVRDYRQKRK